jgi:hypothetical protein
MGPFKLFFEFYRGKINRRLTDNRHFDYKQKKKAKGKTYNGIPGDPLSNIPYHKPGSSMILSPVAWDRPPFLISFFFFTAPGPEVEIYLFEWRRLVYDTQCKKYTCKKYCIEKCNLHFT